MSSSDHTEPHQQSPPPQRSIDESVTTLVLDGTTLVPEGTIAHPEPCRSLSSGPGQISFLVEAARYSVTLDQAIDAHGILASTGQPWLTEYPVQREPLMMHVECTFLNRNTLRVRLGLEANYPFGEPFPVNPEFPPPVLRQHVLPPGTETEPIAGRPREDLANGIELRANDGEIWVNPQGSSWTLGWQSSPFGLHVHHQHHQKQNMFEQACLGPFSPSLPPNGLLNIDGTLVGTELLIINAGEKIQSGGPGRNLPKNIPDTPGVPVKPVPEDARGSLSTHFGGRFLEEGMSTNPPPFVWSDGGWGILMKDPVEVRIASLQDGRAVLGLMMRAGKQGMIDYIVVVGDALEACKEEYPVEQG